MPEVVGIRFRQAGKLYYFDAVSIPLKFGDLVVAKTTHGLELGRVVIPPGNVPPDEIKEAIKPVLRKAHAGDMEQLKRSQKKEVEALKKSREIVKELNLPMKPISAQANLTGNYVTIFFSAEERVNFRELARRLSRSLRARIELKQVGIRDEAKLVGGIGRCGRPLCCLTFLDEFTPVSIRMAKDQDLSLSPMKISGVCGRLLCCLGYESEQYRAMKEKLPKIGQQVNTPLGKAKAVSANPLKETVLVELDNEVTVEFPLSQLSWQSGQMKEEKEGPQEDKPPDENPTP